MSSTQKFLFQVAKKYPFKIFWSILFGFSGAIFNGIGTTLIVPVLLALIGQEASLDGGPPLLQKLLSPFGEMDGSQRLLAMTAVIIVLIFLKSLTNYLSTLISTTLGRRITSDFQEQGLKLILDVDIDYLTKMRVGDLMNRLGGEMNRATLAITGAVQLFTIISTIFVFLVILIGISWKISIATTLLFPLSALLNRGLIVNSKRFSKVLTTVNNQYSSGLVELIGGMRLVRSTGNEGREFKRFTDLIENREKIDFFAKANTGLIGPLAEVVNIVSLFAIVFISRAIFANQLDVLATILPLYMILIFRMLPYIGQLNSARDTLALASSPVEVVYDMLRRDNKSFMPKGDRLYAGIKKEIHFKNLQFAYPSSQNLILKGIDLTLPKGTTLALVGSSGAGKSTLADLLPRFYDPNGGQILLDGIDLREYDIQSVRRAMGIVSQETFLFNNTIRYNITYGRPEATEAEIRSALQRANAEEFISKMPEGLETKIGDRGVMLSGGQRQRLAIARALLQDPDILILDEATSALDTVSERLVQEALDELSRERTTLVIAHRLSTIRNADQIAVLDQGHVVELGTHDELLHQDGLYSQLCALQFAERHGEGSQNQSPLSETISQKTTVSQLSYEARSRLNFMIGSLGLLAEDLVEDPEERSELSREAYEAAIAVLNQLESLENQRPLTTLIPGAEQSIQP